MTDTPKAPQPKDDSLQTISQDDNIVNDDASNPSAAGSAAEDTQDAKDRQIDALIEQTKSLQNQIAELLRNGVSVTDQAISQPENAIGNMTQTQHDYKNSDDYVSLSDLGAEIGKREYKNENMKR